MAYSVPSKSSLEPIAKASVVNEPKEEFDKVASPVHDFFIIDLQRAKYKPEEKSFEVYGIKIFHVAIMGYIIETKPYQDSYLLKIDDTTSFIEVLIEQEYCEAVGKIKKLPHKTSINYKKMNENLPRKDIDSLLQAMKISAINIKKAEDYKVGDLVLIHGKLSQRDGMKRIYTNSIKCIPDHKCLGAFNEWRLDRINFYSEIELI